LARQAALLDRNDAFQEALAATRALFIRTWEQAETTVEREMCWAKVVGLDEVQRQLRRIMQQGEVAARQ